MNKYSLIKTIVVCVIIVCNLICSCFNCFSLADFDFTEMQKKAADLDNDGIINHRDMQLLVDQDYPERPVDGVKAKKGVSYLKDIFTTPSLNGGSDSIDIDPSSVIKVLMIGNSYTYVGNTGGILAELAHRAGYSIIVVEAVHGNYFAKELYQKHDLKMYRWDYSGNVLKTKTVGKSSLMSIAKTEKNWDYVFLQDYGVQIAYWKKIQNDLLKNGLIKSNSNLIANAQIGYKAKLRSKSKKGSGQVEKCAKRIGAGVVYTGEIINKSSTKRENLYLNDGGAMHPTVKSQYINALALYAKIYGKEKLANSKNNPSSFIKAFNSPNGTYDEFVKELDNSFYIRTKQTNYKGAATRIKRSVTRNEAIGYQYLVYNYYDKYVK